MKRFRIITLTATLTALLLLVCDGLYMARLYHSIRANMERDVKAALTELDVDELWYRVEHQLDYGRAYDSLRGRSISGKFDSQGDFVMLEDSVNGGTRELSRHKPEKAYFYVNQMIKELSTQMHLQMDSLLPIRLQPLDSLLRLRLETRGLRPATVAVELADASDSVLLANPILKGSPTLDRFEVTFNPKMGYKYVAYLTPLMRMIAHQMSGVIICTALLILLFGFTFVYMWRCVRKLRSAEEMKESFVNSMTHELKTPVAVAYSAADSLLRYPDSADEERTHQYLTIILDQLKHHSAMVENILSTDFRRQRAMPLDLQPLPVRSLLEEICSNLRLKAEKKVEFSINVYPEDLKIVTDPLHFANIISNLVDNSIKYSGEEVKIEISADESGIRIKDNGIGIAQRHQQRVFDRFYRVDPNTATRGYGIGLYYVKNVCESLGWNVSLRSRPGEGTEFTISF